MHDWENYLDRLQILLLAYALAGVHSLSLAPAAAQELTLARALQSSSRHAGCSDADYMSTPPMGRRLQWLEARGSLGSEVS